MTTSMRSPVFTCLPIIRSQRLSMVSFNRPSPLPMESRAYRLSLLTTTPDIRTPMGGALRPNSLRLFILHFDRLTFFGSIYLVVICVSPTIITGSQTRFGGTAMLILVSVAMRVMMNIQSFLYSDKYEMSYKSKGKYSGSNKRF